MIEPSKILIGPILSEKASDMKEAKKYGFRVATDANKIEIAKAVEAKYKVEVDKVNIVVMKPKKRRFRMKSQGFSKAWKKAIVSLKKGEIDFYKV